MGILLGGLGGIVPQCGPIAGNVELGVIVTGVAELYESLWGFCSRLRKQ